MFDLLLAELAMLGEGRLDADDGAFSRVPLDDQLVAEHAAQPLHYNVLCTLAI